MGFGVDLVGYSARSAAEKLRAQSRVAALVNAVVAATGADAGQVDRQGAGDGAIVFLPASVDLRLALAELLDTASHWLAEDNRRYRDPLRVRIAAVVGPLGTAPLGNSGNTIVECARLLDSPALRAAIDEHPELDLAVLISDQLHTYVVAERYPELPETDFNRVDVQVRNYQRHAWLWLPNSKPDPNPGKTHNPESADLHAIPARDHPSQRPPGPQRRKRSRHLALAIIAAAALAVPTAYLIPTTHNLDNAAPPASSRKVDVSAGDSDGIFYDLGSARADLGFTPVMNADSDVGLRHFDVRAVNDVYLAAVADHTRQSCESAAAWTRDPIKFKDLKVGAHLCARVGDTRYVSITINRYYLGWPEGVDKLTVEITRW
jgi:hypothetical protein